MKPKFLSLSPSQLTPNTLSLLSFSSLLWPPISQASVRSDHSLCSCYSEDGLSHTPTANSYPFFRTQLIHSLLCSGNKYDTHLRSHVCHVLCIVTFSAIAALCGARSMFSLQNLMHSES